MPSGMKINILVFNEEVVATKLRNMGTSLVYTKPLMNEVAQYLIDRATGEFQSQGRARGGSWKKLSTKWLKFKVKHGLDPRILHMGKGTPLRTSFSRLKAPHQVLEIDRYSMRVGTDLEYGASMQFGDPSRKIPARPYLTTNQLTRDIIKRMIEQYVMKEWNGV